MPELAHTPETAPAPPQPQANPDFRYTPVDEIGMPLPLAPIRTERRANNLPETDLHHHFHPRRSPVLVGGLGGKAVRNVRLQRSDYHQHHIDYHGNFDGPPLPKTRAQQFGIVVLASAGYVPDRAISFTDGQPNEVPLTRAQRQSLWLSGDLKIAAPEIIRKFLIDYTTSQDLTDVNDKLVDEFLNTPNTQRRYQLGGMLLGVAIEKATEPIDPFYRTAWKKGLIPRDSSARVQRLIKNKMRYKQYRPLLIDRLEQMLAA